MPILHRVQDDSVSFWCLGCKCAHILPVAGPKAWGFNGDFNRPTLTPSVLVVGTRRLTDEEVELIMKGGKVEPVPTRCHLYVEAGHLKYLDDCTHDLKGLTVPMRDF